VAKANPFRPFEPHADLADLLPAQTGNEINGLGEQEPRRPKVVFWAPDPAEIAFGNVQRWFYKSNPPSPAETAERARRQAILDAPLPDLAPIPANRTPTDWTTGLDRFIAKGECEQVGVAKMRPEWMFDHRDTTFSNVIILGVQHNYDQLKSAPQKTASADVIHQYGRAAGVAKNVAGWIRQQGWDAEPVTGPMAGKLLLIPPALECGFGELGKHGSLINPEFGSGFRLAAVLTDAPFAITPKRQFGIDGFCQSCRICENACPPMAITPEKQTVRGETKWYVDFDKCIPFFAETSGCAICIAVCPWSRPGVGLNLAAKLARRAERQDA